MCCSVVKYSHKPQQPALPYLCVGTGSSRGEAEISLHSVPGESKGGEGAKQVRFGHFSDCISDENIDL